MLRHTSHTANGAHQEPSEPPKADRDTTRETGDKPKRVISYNVKGVIFSREESNRITKGEKPVPCQGRRFGRGGASFDRGAVREIQASIKKAKLALEAQIKAERETQR